MKGGMSMSGAWPSSSSWTSATDFSRPRASTQDSCIALLGSMHQTFDELPSFQVNACNVGDVEDSIKDTRQEAGATMECPGDEEQQF